VQTVIPQNARKANVTRRCTRMANALRNAKKVAQKPERMQPALPPNVIQAPEKNKFEGLSVELKNSAIEKA